MPLEQFANLAQTTLSAAITTTGATSISVTSSTGFPAIGTGNTQQFRVLIDSELMIVTAVSGTTWTVTRGAESTTAATHSSGAFVTHVLTNGALANAPRAMTTTGDIEYLASTGTVTRLPVGTNAQVLGGGTIPAWTTLPAAGTPSLTLSTTNSAGSGTAFIAANATILAFDATNPASETFGAGATVGTATVAARRDHVHPMPADPTLVTVVAKTSSYAPTAATETGDWITMSATTALTFTINSGIFSAGQVFYVQQINTGQVSFAAGASVTITSTGATVAAPKLRARYSSAAVVCTASNTFTIVGDIA